MSIVTYDNTQVGTEWGGAFFDGAALAVGDFGGVRTYGAMQFTLPAPNEILVRSIDIHLTPDVFIPPAAEVTDDLSIGLVNDINAQPFGPLNFPSDSELVSLYTIPEITFVAGVESVIPFNMEPNVSLVREFAGGFNTAPQVFGHSNFQGVLAIVLTLPVGSPTVTFTLEPTIEVDQEPFLTGLPTTKHRLSRADWCPRCGRPIFREQLVRDGYTKSLVCRDCWDRDEERYPPFKHPKEINP